MSAAVSVSVLGGSVSAVVSSVSVSSVSAVVLGGSVSGAFISFCSVFIEIIYMSFGLNVYSIFCINSINIIC